MGPGGLWIGDLGYFALTWMSALGKQGVSFLIGCKEPVVVWNGQGERVEVLDLLPRDGQETVDIPVSVGVTTQVQARLIARKMSAEVVKRRRESLKGQAHKQGKPITARQWDLVQWTIVLTHVPPPPLPPPQALPLFPA